MGFDAPFIECCFPLNPKDEFFDRDFSIREVKCECGKILCALVIAEEHEAEYDLAF